jgi:hypothetical protein
MCADGKGHGVEWKEGRALVIGISVEEQGRELVLIIASC